jgi:hypothetical protein
MEQTIYLGNAWEDQYGLNVSINVEKFNQALNAGKLEVNKYGDVKVRVVKLKTQNERSKATHYVAVPKEQRETFPKATTVDDSLPF